MEAIYRSTAQESGPAMDSATTKRPSQVILWSQGRTACHLLEKMLFSKQPNAKILWHPFLPAREQQVPLLSEESIAAGIPHESRAKYDEQQKIGIENWQAALDEAQVEKKVLLMHEHPQFGLNIDRAAPYAKSEWKSPLTKAPQNVTCAPDQLLLHPGTIPVFTFKHPAYICRDAYRFLVMLVGGEVHSSPAQVLVLSNLRWQHELASWYEANGIEPIIIESEDYVTSPELVKEVCRRAGLDPEAATFKWDKVPQEEQEKMHPNVQFLLKTLMNSDGVRPELARSNRNEEVDLDVEEGKWKEEFGEEGAKFIRAEVEAFMPDYEDLRARKLKL